MAKMGLWGKLRNPAATFWPWGLLLVALGVVIWHDLDFPEDIDPEFPKVVRPTFSRRPPPAYRLAEPGDTLDRVMIYLSSGAVVLAVAGLLSGESRRDQVVARRWVSGLSISLAAFWYSAAPGPTFDGWHGLGWRTILNVHAPLGLRFGLAAAALVLTVGAVAPFIPDRRRLPGLWRTGRRRLAAYPLIAAACLCLLRQVELPGVEPVGYWPRAFMILGLLAWCSVLVRLLPMGGPLRFRAMAYGAAACLAWYGMVKTGIEVTWLHRPLARMRTIEPGKLYISAMPDTRGLEIAWRRHHFKTIINLFPEDTPLRSPLWPQELKFVREHGIRYLRSPADAASSDAFLEETLRTANDPSAWPILVHCHGCQDRTPAWVGIYRFLYKGDSLAAILRDIERQRGYCPKASVILLYNRVLRERAPARFAADPTSRILLKAASTTHDPYYDQARKQPASSERARGDSTPKVSLGTTGVRPTL